MAGAAANQARMSGEWPSFPSTRWSLVLAAGAAADGEHLAQLCETYWYPLYAYVRRRGYRAEDAGDLTQEFSARFLEKEYLGLADPDRGRFRAFLLTAMKHFLNDQWDRARSAQRGGGRRLLSWDAARAEDRWRTESDGAPAPEKLYERRWATALLEQVFARLRQEYAADGRLPLFEALRACLWDTGQAPSYVQLAADLGISEAAVKMAVHRLRSRYRHILRSEIAQTIAAPGDLEDEINRLFAAFE